MEKEKFIVVGVDVSREKEVLVLNQETGKIYQYVRGESDKAKYICGVEMYKEIFEDLRVLGYC